MLLHCGNCVEGLEGVFGVVPCGLLYLGKAVRFIVIVGLGFEALGSVSMSLVKIFASAVKMK